MNRRPQPHIETEVVIDEERGQYILHTLGWKEKARVWNTPLYVRLHNGKIWVETDWIEEGVTEKLLAAGLPDQSHHRMAERRRFCTGVFVDIAGDAVNVAGRQGIEQLRVIRAVCHRLTLRKF